MPRPYTERDLETRLGHGSLDLGKAYVMQGAVLTVKVHPNLGEGLDLEGRVRGSRGRPYHVAINWDGEKIASTCTCSWGGRCKHVAAVMLVHLQGQASDFPAPGAPSNMVAFARPHREPPTPPGLTRVQSPDPKARREVAARSREAPAADPPGWRLLIGQLRVAQAPASPPQPMTFRLRIEPNAGAKRGILLASIWVGGTLTPPGSLYGHGCAPGVRLMRDALLPHLTPSVRSDGWSAIADRSVDEILQLLAASNRVEDAHGAPLTILPWARIASAVEYVRDGEEALLRPTMAGQEDTVPMAGLPVVGYPAGWTLVGQTFHPVDLIAQAFAGSTGAVRIPAADRQEFERRFLPDLVMAGQLVREGEGDRPVAALGQPLPQLLLEEAKGKLRCRLGFLYGGVRVEADEPTLHVGPPEGPWCRRDAWLEREQLGLLRPPPDPKTWKRPPARKASFALAGEAALDFLLDEVPALLEQGFEVLGEDRLTTHRIGRGTPFASFTVSSGIDWLGLEGTLTVDGENVPWPALAQALANRQRYVRLGSGGRARLPADWLASQREVLEALDLDWEQLGRPGGVRVPRHQAPALAAVLDRANESHTDAPWRAFLDKLRTFGGIEAVPVPAGFVGELRPYQQQGLNYLAFLRDYGLGGILADDMGLGKTVQAAALLLANHALGHGLPSLVVAPASVVANWQLELARFAPALRTVVYHGLKRGAAELAAADVVITTYATARRDLAEHQQRTYHTVILDEAQAIKNPESQTARAMRSLLAAHKLCLTGTPVENHLLDLWSQFAFVMPGLLGSAKAFKTQYADPIAAGNPRALADLKAKAAPFILRRLKQDVALELPPRQDILVWCDMPAGQRKLYETVLAVGRARVMAAVEDTGIERNQITILDALLKLRQVCCHPALLASPETLHLPSAKLEAFSDLVHELIEGGHRALVFSQFTTMLAHLRAWLDAEGIPYAYLDGGTKNRQAEVDHFNRGTMPLFLISLKAGGTGLNLVGADYVIHYDPWWNPAVEDQATDRAHRIGQTRQVFSYKLICRGTIEEKLLTLQERKRALVRDLLEVDASGKALTREDLAFLFGAGDAVDLPSPAPRFDQGDLAANAD